jgi:hypothetical protein
MFAWLWKRLGYYDVLVLGSAHLDTIVDTAERIHDDVDPKTGKVEHYVQYGTGVIRKSVGGSAYNISVNIAKAPRLRWQRHSVGLFTYLPSGIDLSNLIVRKLKVAGVRTKYVKKIRAIALAGGEKLVPPLGSFVGLRYTKKEGGPTGVDLARSSSILRNSDLIDETEETRLLSAVGKSKIFVIDTDTHDDVAVKALGAAQECGVPLFVGVMSIDALETYLHGISAEKKSKEPTPHAVCVGVRAAALRTWFEQQARQAQPALKESEVVALQRAWSGESRSMDVADEPSGTSLCAALNAHNVLVTTGLACTVFSESGRFMRTIVDGAGALNWLGTSDAAFSAIIDSFARKFKRGRPKNRDLINSIIGTPDQAKETDSALQMFVLNVLNTPGATRNAGIDSIDIEHPILEWWYKTRVQIARYVGIYSLGLFTAFLKTVVAGVAFEWGALTSWFVRMFGR